MSAVLVPIREFIADVPAPGSDHRKHQPPTLREQNLIDVPVARADLLWQVGNIKLDGSTAARFDVDEQQAVTGAEDLFRDRPDLALPAIEEFIGQLKTSDAGCDVKGAVLID